MASAGSGRGKDVGAPPPPSTPASGTVPVGNPQWTDRKVDLSGFSARKAAHAVLAETNGRFVEAEEIGRRAIGLNYRRGDQAEDFAIVLERFIDTMRRNPDEFEKRGSAFRLAEGRALTVGPRAIPVKKALADYAEEVLRKAAQPLNVHEIIRGINDAGYKKPAGTKKFYNSVYSAMDRAKSRFVKLDSGLWWLVEVVTG